MMMIRSLSRSWQQHRCWSLALSRSIAAGFSTGTHKDVVVSILGLPNSGKSTLFNRLMCKEANRTYRLSSEKKPHGKTNSKGRVGSAIKDRHQKGGAAIVSAVPGTTRDRRECIGRIGGTTFRLIDTAGVDGDRIVQGGKDPLKTAMVQQTALAAQMSDLILLLFDARVGVTADLTEITRWLRTKLDRKQPILLLANKLEGDKWVHDESMVLENLYEAERLGFNEPKPISALHGEGLDEIAIAVEAVAASLHREESEAVESQNQEKPLQLAILGRQNVGKSTLVNALLKRDRVITGATPGLTRDAIAIEWSWNGRPVKLVDTAGIRRKNQRANDIEHMAVLDAMRAMKVADVAVLVLDADAGVLQRQELAIADAVVREGRSLVVAANKMDLLVEEDYSKEDYAHDVREQIELRLPMLRQTPVIPMSSLTGECVEDLMPVVFNARDRWERKIPTGQLNAWLEEVIKGHAPPLFRGRATRIKYIIQTKGRPPTFLLFCNVDELPTNYIRFLMRNFQDTFEMFGMEVRMAVKKTAGNPYAPTTRKRVGFGLGGREARKKRFIQELQTSGGPIKRRRKSRGRR